MPIELFCFFVSEFSRSTCFSCIICISLCNSNWDEKRLIRLICWELESVRATANWCPPPISFHGERLCVDARAAITHTHLQRQEHALDARASTRFGSARSPKISISSECDLLIYNQNCLSLPFFEVKCSATCILKLNFLCYSPWVYIISSNWKKILNKYLIFWVHNFQCRRSSMWLF